MPTKFGLRGRGAVGLLIAALAGGGTAAAAPRLPDLNATSLSSLRGHDDPALSAAVRRILAQHDGTR
jgi:FXSXX-COOH protein